MTNESGIVPVDVKVLVYPDPVEEKTAGGIIRPDALRDKEKYASTKGTLVAVGPNAFAEWGSDNVLQAGDRIVTAQYAGVNVKGDDGREYRLCNDEEIIATLPVTA